MLALTVAVLLGFTEAADWSYDGKTAPSYWKDQYPKCGGQNQSPIDLPANSKLVYDASLGKFNFTGYSNMTANSPILKNNGHTVQLDINDTSVGKTYMTGGGLVGKYVALQLHFHWGPDNKRGSEHTFRGREFPLELHIVHIKDNMTLADAKNVYDGLAVLGIFFLVDGENNTDIQPLVEALRDIRHYGQSRPLNLDFSRLMPAHVTEFYRYNGSLTTPTCDEAVIWTLFEDKITISDAQMREFRALYEKGVSANETKEPLDMNYRPVLPLNSRTVKKSFDKAIPDSWHWGYHGYEAPENWPLYYEECGRAAQSPIDIPHPNKPEMVFDSSMNLDTLTFINYDQAFNGSLSNNGHAVQIDIAPSAGLAIKNGGLPGTFRAAQFHLHWGPNDQSGSEHTLQGKMYPMEIHIVHYNEKYGSVAGAVSQPDGLAVVGFFYQVSPVPNGKYSRIVSELPKIAYKNSPKVEIPNINMVDLTHQDLRLSETRGKHLPFYRYKGSLTTPGCAEVVTWTVMEPKIQISASQIDAFREMLHITSGPVTHEDKMVTNYRPVQPLNYRAVYMSLDMKTTTGTSDASSLRAIIVIPILALWSSMW
ncbi:uncharacterized protein LOC127871465 isoform X2 [Dreissena polymorpha]|uniref:uncharacterized protein LOC127871465 isoform X2 n=1 Tax=Dreissena polymorpha TaxID=45954 RepID=UPI0022656E46|nr:uncharacterized protein LOC127871465 isoform X2 [Dreissena polymorpha]